VLHAIPHGDADADIDHLVIGPPGVFVINSAGPVAAEVEARAASRSLSRATGAPISATAVLVAEGASPIGPARVAAARLVGHLRGLPTVFGPDVVASVARAAEEWTTWRPFGPDAGHADPDDAFARLHAEVTRARIRRVLWQLAGAATVVVAVVAVASRAFL